MDAVAPVDGVEVSKGALIGADAVLSLVVAAAPLLSAELVAPLTTALRRGIPAVGAALASVLHTFASACSRLRVQQQLLFVMIHGALTYACGDGRHALASAKDCACRRGGSCRRRHSLLLLGRVAADSARDALGAVAHARRASSGAGARASFTAHTREPCALIDPAIRREESSRLRRLWSGRAGFADGVAQPEDWAAHRHLPAADHRRPDADPGAAPPRQLGRGVRARAAQVRARAAPTKPHAPRPSQDSGGLTLSVLSQPCRACFLCHRPRQPAASDLLSPRGAAGLPPPSWWPPPPSPWAASSSTRSRRSRCSRRCATWASSGTPSTWRCFRIAELMQFYLLSR